MGTKATEPADEPSWDGLVRRSIDIDVRAVNEEERTVEFVASTDTLDAHGEIVEQKFDLKRYKKNPVVLWMHNRFGFLDGSRAEDFLTIGQATKVKIEDGQLAATIKFVEGDGPDSLTEKIWRRIVQRALRAVSIGFRPGKVTEEEENGKRRFRLSNNELFEISVVTIPSNPDAVAKSIAFEHDQFRRLAAKESAVEGEKQEPSMDPKELQKSLDEAKAALAVSKSDAERASKDLVSEREKSATLEKKLADLEKAGAELAEKLVAETKRADDLESKLVDTEVTALVGKKITPDAKEKFVALRKKDAALFADIVKGLPDLALTEDVTGNDPEKTNKASGNSGAASRLIASAKAKAAAAAKGN